MQRVRNSYARFASVAYKKFLTRVRRVLSFPLGVSQSRAASQAGRQAGRQPARQTQTQPASEPVQPDSQHQPASASAQAVLVKKLLSISVPGMY